MTAHKIFKLQGAFLAAAVAKSQGFQIRMGRNTPEPSSVQFCQRLIVGCDGPKVQVPDRWELFVLRWAEFGQILEGSWLPITTKLLNQYGSEWECAVAPSSDLSLLTKLARVYVKSKNEDQTEIDLPDPVYYKEWETQ